MRILRNDGISVVALVIVILLLSTLGITLTSLIITKQKSALLPLKSTQAFYAAQAGIEYAIRYANEDDNQSDFGTDPKIIFPDPPDALTKSLDTGSFTVTYDEVNRIITSTGTAGTAIRKITLDSFHDDYVTGEDIGGGITLDPENALCREQKIICVPTVNNYDYDVYIFKIELAKEGGQQARLNQIMLGRLGATVWTGKKVGVSTTPDILTPFRFNQVDYYTMAQSVVLKIEVQATAEVSGEWHLTFHYSRQTDLSDPETSTIPFIIYE